jgi:hypothetical protein
MANRKYIVENRIRRDLADEYDSFLKTRKRRRTKLLLCGIPLLVVLALSCNFVLCAYGVGLCALAYFVLGIHTSDEIKESGLEGESRALSILRQLPDSYTIFNQVLVPDQSSSTGSREIDYLVCGPNGLFAIEVKNNNGTIRGEATDTRWTVSKVGRGGTPYDDTMRNPVRQLKAQIHPLSKHFEAKDIRVWINGIVAFSNGDWRLRIGESSKIPVIHAYDLVQYITEFVPNRVVRDVEKAINVLAQLAGKTPAAGVASIACT